VERTELEEIMRLINLSVCVHKYTTGKNGGALLRKLLHWQRYAL